MSRNVRVTTALTARIREHLAAAAGSLLESCSSQRLDGFTNDAYSLPPTETVPGPVAEVLSGPAAAILAARAGVTTQLEWLLAPSTSDGLLAAAAAPLLGTLADTAADMEREVTADVVAAALREDLFADALIRADGPAVTGIEAWLGPACVLVAVEPGGGLLIDHADPVGACGDTQRRLEEALTRRGLLLTKTATDDHDLDTGPLVTAAAAVPGAPNLATALAEHAAPSIRRSARDRNRQHSGRVAQPAVQVQQ